MKNINNFYNPIYIFYKVYFKFCVILLLGNPMDRASDTFLSLPEFCQKLNGNSKENSEKCVNFCRNDCKWFSGICYQGKCQCTKLADRSHWH